MTFSSRLKPKPRPNVQDQDFMIQDQDQDFHFCPRGASRPWSRGLHHWLFANQLRLFFFICSLVGQQPDAGNSNVGYGTLKPMVNFTTSTSDIR